MSTIQQQARRTASVLLMDGQKWQSRLLDLVLGNLVGLLLANYIVLIATVTAGFVFDLPATFYLSLAIIVLPLPVYWLATHHTHKTLDVRTRWTESKLSALCQSIDSPPTVTVIGATYLDLRLFQVESSTLGEQEWTGLEPIKVSIGGSAFRVAKSIALDYGLSLHFISVRSGNEEDPLAGLMLDLLKEEHWLPLESVRPLPQCHTPVTVLVTSAAGSSQRTTMFTHRGPLSRLDWDLVKETSELTDEPRVLYVGGFFKTDLWEGLDEHLERLKANSLVIVDHGRLPAEDPSKVAVSRLKSAFRRSRVDVYLCSYLELIQLFGAGRERRGARMRLLHLRRLARELKLALPVLTVVRYRGSVYVLHRGTVTEIPSSDPDFEPETYSASKFNAGFIVRFSSTYDSRSSLLNHAVDSARAAIYDQAS